jgi:hypothetical protein
VIEEATHEGRPRVQILAAAKHMIFEPKVPDFVVDNFLI